MYKLKAICFYAGLMLLLQGVSYATDSEIAVVRDRYGGSLQYDTQIQRSQMEQRVLERDRQRAMDQQGGMYQQRGLDQQRPYSRFDQYRTPGGPYGGSTLPQYAPPIYPYGSSYYPPNYDIDPDETQFNMLYEYNRRTMGQ